MMEIVKVVKSQVVDFWLWTVKHWPTIYSNMIWILRKWMWIHAREVKLVKIDKIVKSQNIDFRVEKVQLWLLTKWLFCSLTKVSGIIQHLLDFSTNSSGLGVVFWPGY